MGKLINKAIIQAEVMAEENIDKLFRGRLDTNMDCFICYKSLVEIGFIDHANNGFGCRLKIDDKHELCYYAFDGEFRLQTIYSGWSRNIFCDNIKQVKELYYFLTGKHL